MCNDYERHLEWHAYCEAMAKAQLGIPERVGEIDRREVRRSVERRFNVDRMADDYVSLYRSILGAA